MRILAPKAKRGARFLGVGLLMALATAVATAQDSEILEMKELLG
jgi:hypothetical protein